jgi:hypothetical protein
VTLAIVALAILSGAVYAAVAALGGDEGLPIVAVIVVLGIGVDQISKLIISYD